MPPTATVFSSVMAETKCAQCLQCFSATDRCMKCSSCACLYHLGPECSGISESTFSSMGTKREKWRCRQCRSGPLSQPETETMSAQIGAINDRLKILESIKEHVESIASLHGKLDELLTLKPEIEIVKTAVTDLSDKYDSLLAESKARDNVISELTAQMKTLENHISSQDAVIDRLHVELNESEQYNRAVNLEIHGLPVSPHEDLLKEMTDWAIKLKLASFKVDQIIAVHRLPVRGNKPAPILVKFANVVFRDAWLSARSKLRELCKDDELPQIFLCENLTKQNRDLFWAARANAKEKGYKFVWVKSGRIYLRKKEGDPAVRVMHCSDLAQLP